MAKLQYFDTSFLCKVKHPKCVCAEVLLHTGPSCVVVEFVSVPIPPPSLQAKMNENLTSKHWHWSWHCYGAC